VICRRERITGSILKRSADTADLIGTHDVGAAVVVKVGLPNKKGVGDPIDATEIRDDRLLISWPRGVGRVDIDEARGECGYSRIEAAPDEGREEAYCAWLGRDRGGRSRPDVAGAVAEEYIEEVIATAVSP
jgi:hypothetical protein